MPVRGKAVAPPLGPTLVISTMIAAGKVVVAAAPEKTRAAARVPAVPLYPQTWRKARKRFEEIMNKDGQKFGAAPAAK